MLSRANLSLHDFGVVSVINFKAFPSLTANMLVNARANERAFKQIESLISAFCSSV